LILFIQDLYSLLSVTLSNQNPKNKINVKSGGQECPPHIVGWRIFRPTIKMETLPAHCEFMRLSLGVGTNLRCGARVLGILVLCLIGISCGDQYRPVAIPIVGPQPDPAAFHFALVLSDNGIHDPGASSRLDVSGDTNIGVAQLGLGPAHAALNANAGRVYVANTLEDTVSSYAPGTATTVTTTSLPAGSNPIFVNTTENGTVYVANFGSNTVAAISTGSNVALSPLIAVGNHPVALVETPDQKKLYAVNQGDGTVSSISLVDRTVVQTIATGAMPVWALARSDSARVYVLNSGTGTVSAIDTASDLVVGSATVGAGANFMAYSARLNRLYVTNSVANTLTAVSIAADPPSVLFTVPVAPSPNSVAVLPDGSRAYVVSSQTIPPCTSDPSDVQLCMASQVTVVNTTGGNVKTVIPLESTVNITAATQSGSATSYTYTLVSGPALRPGMEVVITGMADAGNNGTFTLTAASSGIFAAVNNAGVTASSQSGIGAVVVEVNSATPTGCSTSGLGVPGGVLGGVRFRSFAAASADSTKVLVAKCDAGSTAVIRTSDDVPVLDMAAPLSANTPSNGGNALPQNPVFVLAGP
jgi:YVTN family beta-propeller protein